MAPKHGNERRGLLERNPKLVFACRDGLGFECLYGKELAPFRIVLTIEH